MQPSPSPPPPPPPQPPPNPSGFQDPRTPPPPVLPPALSCRDLDDGARDTQDRVCRDYLPGLCNEFDDGDFTSTGMCCACGGGESFAPPPPYIPPPSPPPKQPPASPSPPPTPASPPCVDTEGVREDSGGGTCAEYYVGSDSGITVACGSYDDDDFTAETFCCACGGGQSAIPPPSAPKPSLPPPAGPPLPVAPPRPPTSPPSPPSQPPPFAPVCTDQDNGATDRYSDGCATYTQNPSWCAVCFIRTLALVLELHPLTLASATRKPAELHRSVPKTAISNFLPPGVAALMRRAFARSKCVARAAAATPSIHLGVRQTHQTWHRGTRRLRVRRCRLATSSSRAAKTSRRWWHRQRWPTTRSCR